MSETTTESPIADLSYRSYDGPLETRALRWWLIALANLRACLRRPMFWVWAVLSAGGYFFSLLFLFLRARMPAGMMGQTKTSWVDYFMSGLPCSLFFLFLLTLLIGAGSIAADHRANALLVYLSKPITRADYLLGKWVGIFVPLFTVAFVPAGIVYAFGALSFVNEDFFSSDRLLLLRIAAVCAMACALHASLILGFSAGAKSPRMALGFYAGFYFLTVILAAIVAHIFVAGRGEFRSPGQLDGTVMTVGSMSVPGIIEGLAQHIYRRGPEGFAGVLSMARSSRSPGIPMPNLWVLLAVYGALTVLPALLASARVRAVEVVRG